MEYIAHMNRFVFNLFSKLGTDNSFWNYFPLYGGWIDINNAQDIYKQCAECGLNWPLE